MESIMLALELAIAYGTSEADHTALVAEAVTFCYYYFTMGKCVRLYIKGFVPLSHHVPGNKDFYNASTEVEQAKRRAPKACAPIPNCKVM